MNIEVRKNGCIHYISINDLLYCTAVGNYTNFVLKNKKILVNQSLKNTIQSLPSEIFYRCHKSVIVNLSEIMEYNLKKNTIILKNNSSLAVSIRRKKQFQFALKHFANSQL